jgi:hypothetical protein
MDLRSDVQLKGEEVIEQVNDFITKIIEEIDEYEQELIEFNKTNSKSLDGFNSIVKELDSFHADNIIYLKEYLVDDQVANKSNDEATKLIKKAELEIQNLKDIIFNGKLFIFEKNSKKINESILGAAKILDTRMNSTILLNRHQTKELMALCEFPMYQNWSLVYRASQDGFEASQFHSKCDDKPNTLIIVKSVNGNIFGGYTEQSWSFNSGNYRHDLNSFIFSLNNINNNNNQRFKLKWSKNNYSIYCANNCGPTFGAGNDLHIADKSNSNTDSYSNIGKSYTHSNLVYGSNEARTFLAGSFNFQVEEIEVFTKELA